MTVSGWQNVIVVKISVFPSPTPIYFTFLFWIICIFYNNSVQKNYNVRDILVLVATLKK